MTILTANFKHLYQCRRLWLWYFYILGFGYTQVFMYAQSDRNAGEGLGMLHFWLFFFTVYFSGLLIGSLEATVLSKPFTYTLPGHRRVPRVVVVSASLVASFVTFLIALWLEPLTGSQKWLAATALYFLALAACLIIARQAFRESNPRFAVIYGILGGLLFTAPVFFQIRYDFLGIWITEYPFRTIVLSLVIIVIFYRQLNCEKLARIICGKTVTGLAAGAWKTTQKRQRAIWRTKGDKHLSSPAVNTFFLDRMKQSVALSTARYCWGVLYERLATYLKIQGLLLLLVAGTMLGYLPTSYIHFLLFPLCVLVNLKIPIHSSLLLPAGRMERFWGATTLIASSTALVLTLFLVMVGLSHLVAPIMPEVSMPKVYRNTVFVFHTINGAIIYGPLALLPFIFACQILSPQYAMIWAMASVMPLIMGFQFLTLEWSDWLVGLTPITILPPLLILWALLFLLLLHICQKRSLVSQKA